MLFRNMASELCERSLSNRQWIGLAPDVCTREITGVYIGKHNKKGAEGLWNSLFAVSRQGVIGLYQKSAVKQIILVS